MGHSRAPIEVDPVLDPSHVDHWLMHEASPREKKEFSNVYDRSEVSMAVGGVHGDCDGDGHYLLVPATALL